MKTLRHVSEKGNCHWQPQEKFLKTMLISQLYIYINIYIRIFKFSSILSFAFVIAGLKIRSIADQQLKLCCWKVVDRASKCLYVPAICIWMNNGVAAKNAMSYPAALLILFQLSGYCISANLTSHWPDGFQGL